MLAKAYFTFMTERDLERLGDLTMAMADSIGLDLPEDQLTEAFVPILEEFIRSIGLRDLKLSDYGMKREDIPALTETAFQTMGRLFEITPTEMTAEDVNTIFEKAFE